MDVVGGCLIVPVHDKVDAEAVKRLRKRILTRVKATRVRGVIMNVSAVKVIDSYCFSILSHTAEAVSMLGAVTVFVGFQPGVASALVDLDIELDGILTAVTTEDAFEIMRNHNAPEQSSEATGISVEYDIQGDGKMEVVEDGGNR